MSAGIAPARRTATCACQCDAHFSERPVPRTTRHAYGARFPVTELHVVGTWPRTNAPVLKCGPCRDHHTTAAFARVVAERGR